MELGNNIEAGVLWRAEAQDSTHSTKAEVVGEEPPHLRLPKGPAGSSQISFT
jgi:hypothetical protein